MRARLAALAVALLSATPAYAASEPLPLPGSSGCAHGATLTDDAAGTVSGVLYGSVAVADLPHRDGATSGPATVTLTCSVQTSSYSPEAPDDFTASGTGVNAAVVAPAPFTVPAPDEWHTVYVCSRADVTDASGTTSYWSNSQNGMWSTTPGTCDGAPQCLSTDENCSYVHALLVWLLGPGPLLAEADEEGCPLFASLAPGVPGVVDVTPEGDVYVAGEFFWDCPPYA